MSKVSFFLVHTLSKKNKILLILIHDLSTVMFLSNFRELSQFSTEILYFPNLGNKLVLFEHGFEFLIKIHIDYSGLKIFFIFIPFFIVEETQNAEDSVENPILDNLR